MVIRKTRMRPSLSESMLSVTAFLYFVIMAVQNFTHLAVVQYTWLAVIGVSFFLGLIAVIRSVEKYKKILRSIFVFFFLFLISIIANIVFVGNASIKDILFFVVYFGVFFMFSDERLEDGALEAAIYTNCVILSAQLLKAGLGNPIFSDLSNNYVSVLLFLPLSVYYVRREYKHKPISVLPAAAICIPCLLATGRGGILFSGLFLLSIVFYHLFLRTEFRGKRKHALLCLCALFGVAAAIFCVPFLFRSSSISGVFMRFSKFGMYGTGRMGIWTEYLSTMSGSARSILFGQRFSELSLMVRYRNNLHNSFLSFHAMYGLLLLLYLFVRLVRNGVVCLKEKRWIYLFAMFLFFGRALTDKIFGGGVAGTPVMFFLLFYIDYGKSENIS